MNQSAEMLHSDKPVGLPPSVFEIEFRQAEPTGAARYQLRVGTAARAAADCYCEKETGDDFHLVSYYRQSGEGKRIL